MKHEIGEEHVSMLLRSLPPSVPPSGLRTSLRVIASKERQRLIQGHGMRQICASWLDRTRDSFQELLRPLALPAAGGVFSAVVLFSMWLVPTYPLRAKIMADIPTSLTTEVDPSVDVTKGSSGVGLRESVLVDVEVDDQGRFVDYQVVRGASAVSDPTTRRRMENLLWFTKFAPATSFGTPMAGRVRVLLLPSPWILSVPRSDWPGIYVKG
jgi:hypothetical protein